MPNAFTWPLLPDQIATPPSSGSGSSSFNSSPIDGILGFGLTRPFRRDLKNDFATDGGAALIKSSVSQILGTRAQGAKVQGELAWRQEFGSRLYLLRNRKGGHLDELARAYCLEALQRWEPRVILTGVGTTFDPLIRALRVHVKFDFISRNRPGNNVLIKGLETNVPVI